MIFWAFTGGVIVLIKVFCTSNICCFQLLDMVTVLIAAVLCLQIPTGSHSRMTGLPQIVQLGLLLLHHLIRRSLMQSMVVAMMMSLLVKMMT